MQCISMESMEYTTIRATKRLVRFLRSKAKYGESLEDVIWEFVVKSKGLDKNEKRKY